MKRFTTLFLVLMCCVPVVIFSQIPCREFEIVESIPVETDLDNTDIRNTAQVWLGMINGAERTLDIEQFYISNSEGEPLEDVISAIESAADRGIEVRIIAEVAMSKTYPHTLKRLSRRKNIEVRIIEAFKNTGGVQHSKFFIVDKKSVFIGSQNFDWRALKHIHEIGLRIEHAEYAEALTEIFDLDWKQCHTGKLEKIEKIDDKNRFLISSEKAGRIEFYSSCSPHGNIPDGFVWDEKAIVDLMDNAEKCIYIQLLSYSPSTRDGIYYDVLDNAIRRAAIRGVEVKLLCSDWCQKKYEMPFLKSLVVLPDTEVKLSTIPEWSGGYISYSRVEHCKYMVVDDQYIWLGTSNWKKDYFHSSRNIGLVVKNSVVNSMMKNIFLKSWESHYSWSIRPELDYKPKYYGEKK